MIGRRALLGLTAGAFMAFPGVTAAQPQMQLAIGQINLTFYVGAAAVVVEVLERLGHKTTVVEGPHSDIYARLGRDEVDVLVASWLPHAHGHLHEPLADKIIEAATLYEGARLFWSVPAHVPEDAVRSIDDLKKPDVLTRIDKEIVGVGPGSGLMQGSEKIIARYGLAEAGYTLRTASPADWARRLADATSSGQWIVMPLWQPQYLNALYPIRILDEPQGVFGTDRAVVVVRKSIWEALPERSRKVLGRVSLSIPIVTELERRIVVERQPPRSVAQAWIAENAAHVDTWFAP